jgi:glycosyltransferase involved in cell wall biosynthesis
MIDFYGHFSGPGSYVVVSEALSNWMKKHNIEHRIIDIRTHKILRKKADEYNHTIEATREHREGTAFLMGFPSWWLVMPSYERRIGFHVADFDRLPQTWINTMSMIDHILTPSNYLAQVFERYVTTPVDVVPHGISQKLMPRMKSKYKKKVNYHHYCTSMEPTRKGSIQLINAFMAWNNPDVNLIIWTDSPVIKRALSECHDPRIQLKPQKFLCIEEQKKRLQRADFVVAPSLAEGFGLIPLEAVACGTPVIMSNNTGHKQYIKSLGESAITVDPLNYQSIKDGLVKSYENRRAYWSVTFDQAVKITDQWNWDTVLSKSQLKTVLSS